MATKANKELYEKTAARLRQVMEANEIRAIDLAERSGVSKSNISQYINAYHAPNSINAYKMSLVLNCSPAYLMGFDIEVEDDSIKRAKESYKRLSAYAIKIAEAYEKAPANIKKAIDAMLETENGK